MGKGEEACDVAGWRSGDKRHRTGSILAAVPPPRNWAFPASRGPASSAGNSEGKALFPVTSLRLSLRLLTSSVLKSGPSPRASEATFGRESSIASKSIIETFLPSRSRAFHFPAEFEFGPFRSRNVDKCRGKFRHRSDVTPHCRPSHWPQRKSDCESAASEIIILRSAHLSVKFHPLQF